jgi:hypothetical protein
MEIQDKCMEEHYSSFYSVTGWHGMAMAQCMLAECTQVKIEKKELINLAREFVYSRLRNIDGDK